jgi:hypothetical protein
VLFRKSASTKSCAAMLNLVRATFLADHSSS